MSYPGRPSPLADRRWRMLVVCLVVLILACSRDDAADPRPSTFRVLKAIATRLLSNSVEVSEETAVEAPVAERPPAAPVEPPPVPPRALGAEPAETCFVPYKGTVTIIPVRTATALQRSIDDRPPTVPIVYETDDTAIWEDGRVLTLDVENLGVHLNAVGWASNHMRILGTGSRPGGSSANLGWDSGQSSFKKRASSKKRRRRRG